MDSAIVWMLCMMFACAQGGPASVASKKKAKFDFSQRLRPDPNYKNSAEKRLRDLLREERGRSALAKHVPGFRAAERRRPVAKVEVRVVPRHRIRRIRIPLRNTLLWAGIGAIAGHQSHHTWEGAALGAAFGALLDAARSRPRRTP